MTAIIDLYDRPTCGHWYIPPLIISYNFGLGSFSCMVNSLWASEYTLYSYVGLCTIRIQYKSIQALFRCQVWWPPAGITTIKVHSFVYCTFLYTIVTSKITSSTRWYYISLFVCSEDSGSVSLNSSFISLSRPSFPADVKTHESSFTGSQRSLKSPQLVPFNPPPAFNNLADKLLHTNLKSDNNNSIDTKKVSASPHLFLMKLSANVFIPII